jgi:hypothetical protein
MKKFSIPQQLLSKYSSYTHPCSCARFPHISRSLRHSLQRRHFSPSPLISSRIDPLTGRTIPQETHATAALPADPANPNAPENPLYAAGISRYAQISYQQASQWDEKATNKRISTWKRNLIVGSVLLAYYFTRKESREHSESQLNARFINLEEGEILDLISRTQFTTEDILEIYRKSLNQYPSGLLTLEQFAAIVQQQASAVKRRRIQNFQQNKALREKETAERQVEREKLWAAEDEEAAQRGEKPKDRSKEKPISLDNGDEPDPSEEFAEETGPRGETSPESVKKAVKRPNFEWWELFPLYRNSPTLKKPFYDIRELIIGLTILDFDHETWDRERHFASLEGKTDHSTFNNSQIMALTYQPQKKLELAFKFADEDRDNQLNFSELAQLFDKLIRFGHFNPDSLLKQSQIVPPQFTLVHPQTLAFIFLREKLQNSLENPNLSRENIENDPFLTLETPLTRGIHQNSSNISEKPLKEFFPDPKQFISTEEKPTLDALEPRAPSNLNNPAVLSAKISLPEFLRVAQSLANAEEQSFMWYLYPRDEKSGYRRGLWGKFKLKRKEKWQKWLHKYCSKQEEDRMVQYTMIN